jgi:hypothetical protein
MSSTPVSPPVRPVAPSVWREFWAGLITPSPKVLGPAAGFLLLIFLTLTFLARPARRESGDPKRWLQSTRDPIGRASLTASQGARIHLPGSEPAMVWVGPSSLVHWLPTPARARKQAANELPYPIQIANLSALGLNYASAAALIDRFGADFDGVFLLGINAQSILSTPTPRERKRHQNQPRQLAFSSAVLEAESTALGFPHQPLGWSLYDQRDFHLRSRLGFGAEGLLRHRGDFLYHWDQARPRSPKQTAPPDFARLTAHMALLERIHHRLQSGGRARLVLVETPWRDAYLPSARGPGWAEGTAAYHAALTAFSERHHVPWLHPAAKLKITAAAFKDISHNHDPTLRPKFFSALLHDPALGLKPTQP